MHKWHNRMLLNYRLAVGLCKYANRPDGRFGNCGARKAGRSPPLVFKLIKSKTVCVTEAINIRE